MFDKNQILILFLSALIANLFPLERKKSHFNLKVTGLLTIKIPESSFTQWALSYLLLNLISEIKNLF